MAHPGAELYGSDRVLLETVSALADRYDRVVVVLPGDGPLSDELRRRGAEVLMMRSPVLRKNIMRPRGFARFVTDLIAGLWQGGRLMARERPALVFVNTVTVPLWLILARMGRVPSICHVHEAEDAAPRAVRLLLAAPLLLADQIVTNSRFSAEVLGRSIRRLADSAVVVLNAVPGPPEAEIAREAVTAGLRVAYVGRISPRKGVDVAVEAIGQLKDRGVNATLDLYGAVFTGYEWFDADMRARTSELGLSEAITFHGFRSEVWDGIRDADVVVVPSRLAEPFGNTAVEAVLSGRPVVVSSIGGLIEASDGYLSAVGVPPGDSVALADALAHIESDWTRMRDHAWSDRELALRRHDAAGYRREMLDIVDEVDPVSDPGGFQSVASDYSVAMSPAVGSAPRPGTFA